MKTVQTIPEWLLNDISSLLPKSNESNIPKDYRPITCLTDMYKILSSNKREHRSGIMEHMNAFLINDNIFSDEQKWY